MFLMSWDFFATSSSTCRKTQYNTNEYYFLLARFEDRELIRCLFEYAYFNDFVFQGDKLNFAISFIHFVSLCFSLFVFFAGEIEYVLKFIILCVIKKSLLSPF